jgi:hypothetical protein
MCRSNPYSLLARCVLVLLAAAAVFALAWRPARAAEPSGLVIKIAMVEDEDPKAAGMAAAKSLKEQMGDTQIKAVIVSECFEDRENKEKLLEGICSVLPKEVVMGGATYGSFTQQGCTDFDAVGLMGIGGRGIKVSARLVTKMGTSKLTFENDQEQIRKLLHAAGEKLASKIQRRDDDRVLVLIADAHSPKAQYLVEGLQKVLGGKFPITGGCANKNAGQTFVYFNGELHEDSAVGIMLSGDFNVSLTGRQANENDTVIASANEGAMAALKALQGKPAAMLAFNCAGRRSKLDNFEEELAAIQKAVGKDLPLFGCYCAGEIGPVDIADKDPNVLSGGSGWHVMITVIGK